MAVPVFGKRLAFGELRNAPDVFIQLQIAAQGERARAEFGGLGIRAADFPSVGVVDGEKGEEQQAAGQCGADGSATRHEWSECTVNTSGELCR